MKYSKYKVDKLEREQIQIVVPRFMRKEILIAAHESPWSAHVGRNKTYNRLKDYYWPKMRADINHFCATCEVCQLLGKFKSAFKSAIDKFAYCRRTI